MNDWNINNTRQLRLALDSVGGGISGTDLLHDGSHCTPETLFRRISATENLFAAWRMFSRGKHGKKDVAAYERYLEENVFTLQEELTTGRYRHGAYQAFVVRDPKERSIHKAGVRDRLLHQAVCRIIEPLFERSFIFDSFSCRLGKGTHAASRRLRRFLRSASQNNTRTVWVLKCDVRRFFDSVDHEILFALLRKKIRCRQTLRLLRHIIGSFAKSPGKGLPLGSLTSQLFANIYLHELDRFVKHSLRRTWYLRYCDDFVVLDRSRQHLLAVVPQIQSFLKTRLRLDIHPRKINVRSWNQGIDFVGYVHLPRCTVLRTKTERRMLRKLNGKNLSSYLGLCKHADTFELRQMMLSKAGGELLAAS